MDSVRNSGSLVGFGRGRVMPRVRARTRTSRSCGNDGFEVS